MALLMGLNAGSIGRSALNGLLESLRDDRRRQRLIDGLDTAPVDAGPEAGTQAGLFSTVSSIGAGLEQDLPQPAACGGDGASLNRVLSPFYQGSDLVARQRPKPVPCNPLGDPIEVPPDEPLTAEQTSRVLAWIDGMGYASTYVAPEAPGGGVGGIAAGAPAPPAVDPDFKLAIPGLEPTPEDQWRADEAVVDFPFQGPPDDPRFVELRPRDRIGEVKYVRNGWLYGKNLMLWKYGYFPENHVSPPRPETPPPQNLRYSSAETVVAGVDDVDVVVPEEWELRDLARRRLGGLTGEVIEPSEELKSEIGKHKWDPKVWGEVPSYMKTIERRKQLLDLQNKKWQDETKGNRNKDDFKRIKVWRERTIVGEMENIYQEVVDTVPEKPPSSKDAAKERKKQEKERKKQERERKKDERRKKKQQKEEEKHRKKEEARRRREEEKRRKEEEDRKQEEWCRTEYHRICQWWCIVCCVIDKANGC